MEVVILKSDGTAFDSEQEQDKCPHENKQEIQGAGPCPLRTVCVDCGEDV